MASTSRKQAYGMPKKEFISLTEYITWELDGVARTDDEVTALRGEAINSDVEKWHDPFGPARLVQHLELIRDGMSWPLTGTDDTDDINRNNFAKATRWLSKSGLRAYDALAEIEQDLLAREAAEQSYGELEDFIWSEASAKRVTLFGKLWDHGAKKPASEYEEIKKLFFLRRAKFSCGNGYHGKGTLERWPDDDSEQGIMNSVFDKSDPPVAYVEIKLSKDDAMAISEKYRARHTVEADPEKAKQAAAVLKRPNWPLDVALAAVMSPDLEFVTAIAGRDDPGHLCAMRLSSKLGAFKALRHRDVTVRIESPLEAWYTLRKSIFDGEITASGNEVDGPRASGAQIPSMEAGTLELEMDGHPSFTTFLRGANGKAWRNIMISRDGLLKHFPLSGELPYAAKPFHDTTNPKQGAAEHSNLKDTPSLPKRNGFRQAILKVAETAYSDGLPDPVSWPAVKEKLLRLMLDDGLVLRRADPTIRTFQRALRNWTPKSKLAKG